MTADKKLAMQVSVQLLETQLLLHIYRWPVHSYVYSNIAEKSAVFINVVIMFCPSVYVSSLLIHPLI